MNAGHGPDRIGRWLAIAASVVIALTLVAALWVMGSPGTQREANIDNRRVSNLNHIEQLLDNHWSIHDALPPDLVTLAKQPRRRISITDPVDGKPYGYQVTGARTYRLCAVFTTDTSKIPATTGPWHAQQWAHGKGRHCFERKVKSLPGK